MDRRSPTIPNRPNRLSAILYVGPALLFVAAVAYGVLEVHPVNDTWIGLAAGRQILTADQFPLTDTFSYTAAGKVWYNQNWLTHAGQYWLYDRVSTNAVIYANWGLAGAIFVFVLLAAYWRSTTWVGALLAASVVALGCRDFLSARPATTGFFCLAALWALLSALEGQRERRRWWPIALLLPLLLVWGNAHGSFIFGYAVLACYVAHWACLHAFRLRTVTDGRQIMALLAAVLAAVVLTALFGPLGIDNFIHGERVAGSAVWRDVAEWRPPYLGGTDFPPVWRFWIIAVGSAGLLLAGVFLRVLAPQAARPDHSDRNPRVTLFDIAMVGLGLALTLWARRFAPIFLIFGATTVLTAAVWLTRTLRASWRRGLRVGVSVLAGLGGIVIAVETASKARADLTEPYVDHPGFSLLERVTCYDLVPHDALDFIDKNQLQVNLLAEWSLAGAVMLHAPTAKLFVDGRAQQLYEENQYRQYQALFVAPNSPHPTLFRILDDTDTDGVLLRIWERGANLRAALEQSPDWVPVFLNPDYRLFLRVRGNALEQLGERLRTGQAWWPESPAALAGQAFVWRAGTPPDPQQALSCWDRALRKTPALGSVCFRPLITTLLELGRDGEAQRRVEMYAAVLSQPFTGLSEESRRQLLAILGECAREIEEATSAHPDPD